MTFFAPQTALSGVIVHAQPWVTTGSYVMRADLVKQMKLGDPMLEYLSALPLDQWPWTYTVGGDVEFDSLVEKHDEGIANSLVRIDQFSHSLVPLTLLDVVCNLGKGKMRVAMTADPDGDDTLTRKLGERWAPGIVVINARYAEAFSSTSCIPFLVPCPSPLVLWTNTGVNLGFHKSTYSRSLVPGDIIELSERVHKYLGELT